MRAARAACLLVVVVGLAIGGCGGADLIIDQMDDQVALDEGAVQPGSDASDNAMATLVVDGETYVWEKNDWTTCTIDGLTPVWVGFQNTEHNWDDDWFQFIDRGDGGINFSAYLDGEEYGGTGSGEADEIRSDGFTYTGDMTVDGESVDVSLDVTC